MVASDKFSNLQEPYLLLKLWIKDENEKKREIFIELSKSELDSLLLEFNKVQQVRF